MLRSLLNPLRPGRGRRDHRTIRTTCRRAASDCGMATAEYAIATLAACGFATLLIAIMRSDDVRGLLLDIIRRALAIT